MEARKLAPDALISEPGVYDLTMDGYHGQPTQGPSVSSSGLRTIWSESPAHFWAESRMNPDNWEDVEVDGVMVHRLKDQEERPHFSLGRAAHHLLFLGREGFGAEYVVRPDKWADWRSNDAKAWRAEMLGAGLTILTAAEIDQIAGMAKSLGAHPLVKAGILDGAVERSLIWKDPGTGIWLKSRPDVIPNDSGDFADLKTTVSVKTDALRRTLADYDYPMQGALVGMGSEAILKRPMQTFTLVFVEKAAPFCVRVVTLRPSDLERGERQCRIAAQAFADCFASGEWPGPGGVQHEAEYLSPADWGVKQTDDRLALYAADNDAKPLTHAAE
jgi:hypothetical protein